MGVWAILPVKPLRRGKSRLASVMDEAQRTALNRYLLDNILSVLKSQPLIENTIVVSRDPLVLALAREVRWRRALQKLVHRILNLWRNRHEEEDDEPGEDLDELTLIAAT